MPLVQHLASAEPALIAEGVATPPRRGRTGTRHQPLWASTFATAAVLLAWTLAWRAFGPSELGQDGFLSVDLGFAGLPEMLAFTARDVHPPLYYATLHGWFAIAGLTYLTAKYVGIASAALAVALVQRVGTKLAGPATGVVAALLLALSPTFVRLATTTRDFVPGIALSLLSLLLVAEVLTAPRAGRRKAWLSIALAGVTMLALLMSYLHWAFLLAEVGVCGWAWLSWRRAWSRSVSKARGTCGPASLPLGALAALSAGLLLAGPWYAIFLPQLVTKLISGTTGYVEAPVAPTLGAVGQALLTAIIGRTGGGLIVTAAVGWWLVLLLGLALAVRLPSDNPGPVHRLGASGGARLVKRLLLATLVLGWLEVVAILARWQLPKSLAIYMLVLLPLIVLFQALALTRPPVPPRLLAGLVAVVTVLGQLSWYVGLAQSQPIDWTRDQPLNELATAVQPGESLLFSDHARRAQYMLASNWNAAVGAKALTRWSPVAAGGCTAGVACAVVMSSDVSESYLHSTPREATAIVAALVRHGGSIWYAESGEAPGAPSPGRVALANSAYLYAEQHLAGTDLQHYATGTPDEEVQPGATLGGSVTLAAAAFSSRGTPGAPLLVRLVWQDLRLLPASYTEFVHLDDASGRLVAQQDSLPVTGLRPTDGWRPGETLDDRHGVLLPPTLPSGDYQLNVGLYQGQERLALENGTNAIPLGTVHVER